MKKLLLALFLFGFLPEGIAKDFKKQQQSQVRVIKSAYKKGRITEREYDKLMREQYIIEETIDKYYTDDVLTPAEKNRLYDKLERAEKRLKRYKRNGEVY